MAKQHTPARRSRRAPESGPAAEQRILAAIQEAIFEYRLGPGAKLKELALAELFNVSRGTVRAVLARLGHAKLVELRLNRGAVVASPSADESRQIFEARCAIECATVAKLAGAASRNDLKVLRDFVAREKASYARGDERIGLRLSIGFHRKLGELAGNAVLARILEELVARTPLIALTHGGRSPSTCGVDDHLALIEAIARRDARRAGELMREHIGHLESQLNLQRPEPSRTLAEAFGPRAAVA